MKLNSLAINKHVWYASIDLPPARQSDSLWVRGYIGPTDGLVMTKKDSISKTGGSRAQAIQAVVYHKMTGNI
jgi:hypothetical protein